MSIFVHFFIHYMIIWSNDSPNKGLTSWNRSNRLIKTHTDLESWSDHVSSNFPRCSHNYPIPYGSNPGSLISTQKKAAKKKKNALRSESTWGCSSLYTCIGVYVYIVYIYMCQCSSMFTIYVFFLCISLFVCLIIYLFMHVYNSCIYNYIYMYDYI